jgi:hypothetical protein
MTEPAPEQAINAAADDAALALGRAVLGHNPSESDTAALQDILRATAQALKHGFIRRLADHVLAERETESVEEFFENIKSD